MYLHEDKDLFREVIISASEKLGLVVPIVEKDYYVTLILSELSKKSADCVFKGGTSLSKCHHVIKRFSEDVDIAFSNRLSQAKRKWLKNEIIAGISSSIGVPIIDFANAKSRRDYNCYTFAYNPIEGYPTEEKLYSGVKMEVSLSSTAFPTVKLPVYSYVYEFLKELNMDVVDTYELAPFEMNVQSIERTLADKVFALCDYYLQRKTKRYSRHIYDIYMLLPLVKQDDKFQQLVQQVRKLRSEMSICPSAREGINIPVLLQEIIDKSIYKEDYKDITTYFQNEPLAYDTAINALRDIINGGMFA